MRYNRGYKRNERKVLLELLVMYPNLVCTVEFGM